MLVMMFVTTAVAQPKENDKYLWKLAKKEAKKRDTRKCPWLRLSEEHHDSVHVKRQVCYPSEL
jgi:hypothetical protein